LANCDHGRQTIYDPETESNAPPKSVDLVILFDEFLNGGKPPKWQTAEDLATLLTEYVLGNIYSEQTEQWTYCVRYSSRNGHKTVPQSLIEEIKSRFFVLFFLINLRF